MFASVKAQPPPRVGPLLLVALALSSAALSISCLPNIRIQVSSDNLQSAPYVLEMLKQEEPTNGSSSLAADAKDESKFSVVKEETIEEILELEPESAARPVPDGVPSAVLPAELNKTEADSTRPIWDRKPQLPVTSSHLKRPAASDPQPQQPQQSIVNDEQPAAVNPMHAVSSLLKESHAHLEEEDEAMLIAASSLSRNHQAKSRIPPSAAVDEGSSASSMSSDRKQLPDTLEPSQIMQDVSNASQVPAIVTRHYGTNSRTRVTLGGGYVRNKLPPIGLSAEHPDGKPGKLVAAPEGAGERQDEQTTSASGLRDNSRLVEVPERIVLASSMFTHDAQQQQQRPPVPDNILVLNVTSPLGKRDPRCPANGRTSLEHPSACDRYFLCHDGFLSEHTCPNGLMYGTRSVVLDYCVHRWEAVCGEKSLPNPISSPGCRWQWGIFSVQGSPRCTQDFYECRDGQFEVRKCSLSGQVYDDRTKSCKFAEQVGCVEEALGDFKCPPDDQGNTYWPFPRYFLNERALIHCVNDKPAIIRCRDNERVDPEHLHCVQIKTSSTDSSESRHLRERGKKSQTQQQ